MTLRENGYSDHRIILQAQMVKEVVNIVFNHKESYIARIEAFAILEQQLETLCKIVEDEREQQ